MKWLISILCLFTIQLGSAQVEIRIQTGHSSSIKAIQFSNNERYLASLDDENNVVIWDLNVRGQYQKYQSDLQVKSIDWDNTDNYVLLCNDISCEKLNIHSKLVEKTDRIEVTNNKTKRHIIKGPVIRFYNESGGYLFSKTSDYYDEYFTCYDIHKNIVAAGNQDSDIYVYDIDRKDLILRLRDHLSIINDLAFSPSGKYLASASDDRTVILWDVEEAINGRSHPIKRLSTRAYANTEIMFLGTKLIVANEVGDIKSINMDHLEFPLVNKSISFHPISAIEVSNNSQGDILFAASGNEIKVLKLEEDQFRSIDQANYYTVPNEKYIGSKAKQLMEKGFGFYTNNLIKINDMSLNPDGSKLVIGGNAAGKDSAPLKLFDIEYSNDNIKVSNGLSLFLHEHKVTHVEFINNNTFLSCDGSNIIVKWVISDTSSIHFKEYEFIQDIVGTTMLDEDTMLMQGNNKFWIGTLSQKQDTSVISRSGKFEYNKKHKQVVSFNNKEVSVLEIKDGDFVEKFPSFSCNSNVTHLTIHDELPLMLISLENTSIELRDLNSGELITSIITVDHNKRIVMTKSGYYVSSNDAFEAINYVFNNTLYPVAQFDSYYHRYDSVQTTLAKYFNLSPIDIDQYTRAYRAWKSQLGDNEKIDLNNQLETLPNLEINAEQLNEEYLILNLNERSGQYLSSYNIWVNDIPIYGLQGKELEGKNKLIKTDTIRLSSGDNKIQCSVKNLQGIESAKETVFFTSKAQRDPKYYILSIGSILKGDVNVIASEAQDFEKVITSQKNIVDNLAGSWVFNKGFTRDSLTHLKKLLQEPNEEDIVILYLVGHGEIFNSKYYYVTTDTETKSDLPSKGITSFDLESILASSKSRKKLLILNTCNSGGASSSIDDIEAFKLMKKIYPLRNIRSGSNVLATAPGDMNAGLYPGTGKSSFITETIENIVKRERKLTVSEFCTIIIEGNDKGRLSFTKQISKPEINSMNYSNDYVLWD